MYKSRGAKVLSFSTTDLKVAAKKSITAKISSTDSAVDNTNISGLEVVNNVLLAIRSVADQTMLSVWVQNSKRHHQKV